MAVTDTYRRQHDDLLATVAAIQPLLTDSRRLAQDPRPARDLLARLFGKLSVHLKIEDESLYPRCRQHADLTVRNLATRFAAEMAGHQKTVAEFSRKWTDAEVRANAQAFCLESNRLFTLLGDRIRRENNEFYPLVDRAG